MRNFLFCHGSQIILIKSNASVGRSSQLLIAYYCYGFLKDTCNHINKCFRLKLLYQKNGSGGANLLYNNKTDAITSQICMCISCKSIRIQSGYLTNLCFSISWKSIRIQSGYLKNLCFKGS